MTKKLQTTKLALACVTASTLAFVQPANAKIDRTGKRVEIIVDNEFYKDEDVMQAVGQYAKLIKDRYNLEFYIYSYQGEPLFDHDKMIANESAIKFREHLKKSYADNSITQLEGALLIGNLPQASMEYYNGYQKYYRWQTDFYFMDLDGEWRDEFDVNGKCVADPSRNSCTPIDAPNSVFDGNYSKNNSATLGDDFEIWISRVNPYTAVNADQANFNMAKKYLLNWLNKAISNHANKIRNNKALIITEQADSVDQTSGSYVKFREGLSKIYGSVDEYTKSKKEEYIEQVRNGYDWVTFTGHGNGVGVSHGPHTDDFIDKDVYTEARVFHFASCSPAESFDEYGDFKHASIASTHVFSTKGNAVAAVGATRVSGGNQHDDIMYDEARGKFLAEGFLAWLNKRVKNNQNNDIFDWFYAESFIGDPFVTVSEYESEQPQNPTSESFMAFDDGEKKWTSDNAQLSYDNSVKVGESGTSLRVEGAGYKVIVSPEFANTDVNNISRTILLDVWVPSNQYWSGDVQLFVTVASAGIYNEWVGQSMLNDEADNWNTVRFNLNDKVFEALSGTYSDAHFTLALNTNQTAEPYRIDNMRFESAINAPKAASNYVVTFGTNKSSAVRVDGRSVKQSGATSAMTIQKK